MPDEKKKAPRPTGPTTPVFALQKGYYGAAGTVFNIENRFLVSAIQAGVVRKATPEEIASRPKPTVSPEKK